MKKWAIWNKKENKVVHIYDGEDNPSLFGGPWGDASVCCHHEISENLWQYNKDQIELRHVSVHVSTVKVPKLDGNDVQMSVEARDNNGDVITDANGNPKILSLYKDQKIYEDRLMIVKKIGV